MMLDDSNCLKLLFVVRIWKNFPRIQLVWYSFPQSDFVLWVVHFSFNFHCKMCMVSFVTSEWQKSTPEQAFKIGAILVSTVFKLSVLQTSEISAIKFLHHEHLFTLQ